MLIECPFCHARATLPESKEGAKVRCGECSRVYVARPGGARAAKGGSRPNTGLIVGISVGAVALLGLLFAMSQGGAEEEPEDPSLRAPLPAPSSARDDDPVVGWDAPAVKAARNIHKWAFEGETMRLRDLLHMQKTWETLHARGDELATTFDDWGGISQLDRGRLGDRAVELLTTTDDGRELILDWAPFQGDLVEEMGDHAVVHLTVSPRPGTAYGAGETRTLEFKLARHNGRWRVYDWSRHMTETEVAAVARAARTGGAMRGGLEKVELADGSVVVEKQPQPLGHLADTHPDIASEVDRLIATLTDLDLTRESSKAGRALQEIGRPAIPRLLTKLYEIPLDTQERAIQVNLVVGTLRRITGQHFGFKPQVAAGSGTGTTDERRQSAIKQWFAWWYRNADKFQAKEEGHDALGDIVELTPAEKDWLRRHGVKVD